MLLLAPFDANAGPWSIVQRFGVNNFFPDNPYKPWPAHQGIDYGLPSRRVITATHAGVVTWAGLDPRSAGGARAGYGVYVEVTDGEVLRTRSCHFIEGSIPGEVRTGARVQAGYRLGQCDTTGYSFGDHLHLEGHTKDPRYHVPGYVGADGWGRFDVLPYLPATVGGDGQEFIPPDVVTPVDVLQARFEAMERNRNLNYDKFIEAGAALGEALRAWNRVPSGAISPVDLVLRARLNTTWSGRV